MTRLILVLIFILCFAGCASQMHASKGWKFIDKNMPDEAIREFELAYQADPLPGCYLGMYNAYLLKKDIVRAEKYLFEGIERYPDDLFLNYDLGLYYLKVASKRNYKKAIEYFKKCKIIDKNNSIEKHLDELIEEATQKLAQE